MNIKLIVFQIFYYLLLLFLLSLNPLVSVIILSVIFGFYIEPFNMELIRLSKTISCNIIATTIICLFSNLFYIIDKETPTESDFCFLIDNQ